VKVAAVQFGAGAGNLAWLRTELLKVRPDLVVLPELANSHYFPLEPESVHAETAASLAGPFVTELSAIARDVGSHILTGLYLDDGDERTNAAIMIAPSGDLLPGRDASGREQLAYRKVHLCNITTASSRFREDDYFLAGDGYVVWDTTAGRIGCLICYDRHFPEAWRVMRLAGVDIVAVPVASSEASRAWFVAEMQAMSLQQGVYAVAANRAGSEELATTRFVTTYAGLSCITGPDGSSLAVAPFAEPNRVIVALADPDHLHRVRRENRFFEDLRIDVLDAARSEWTRAGS
jgi:N-carbamoylputrescine amidase